MIWTICFLREHNRVCLAMKKRGLGVGKWNGAGGKPEKGEALEDAARRETLEEIGVEVLHLEEVARIEFRDLSTHESHAAVAYISREWRGEPSESEEMRPAWFELAAVPYNQMWSADAIWIPLILSGKKIRAVFEYAEGDTLVNQTITTL